MGCRRTAQAPEPQARLAPVPGRRLVAAWGGAARASAAWGVAAWLTRSAKSLALAPALVLEAEVERRLASAVRRQSGQHCQS